MIDKFVMDILITIFNNEVANFIEYTGTEIIIKLEDYSKYKITTKKIV